jgi:hypothetical protein
VDNRWRLPINDKERKTKTLPDDALPKPGASARSRPREKAPWEKGGQSRPPSPLKASVIQGATPSIAKVLKEAYLSPTDRSNGPSLAFQALTASMLSN